MDCADALIHVSALHDGETVPAEAAQHIRTCVACRQLLQEYAEMGAEVRLIASELEKGNEIGPLPALPPHHLRRTWAGALAARVRVPRFLLALGIAIIVGLSVALGFVETRRESQDLWFRCALRWPQAEYTGPIHPANAPEFSMGYGPRSKPLGPSGFFLAGPEIQFGVIAGIIDIQEVRSDVVSLAIQAKHFDSGDWAAKTSHEKQPLAFLKVQNLREILSGAPLHQYQYKPGTSLQIPVRRTGPLVLEGEVGGEFSKFSWQQFPMQPASDEIVLDDPKLVPEKALLVRPGSAAKASGPNACAYLYVPSKGLVVFSLRPFSGAHEAAVDRSDGLFELDHEWYYLFANTPIASGDRAKTIWVYLAKDYEPSQSGLKWNPATSFVGSSQDITQVLEQLKK